jgi:hypothetical protein
MSLGTSKQTKAVAGSGAVLHLINVLVREFQKEEREAALFALGEYGLQLLSKQNESRLGRMMNIFGYRKYIFGGVRDV